MKKQTRAGPPKRTSLQRAVDTLRSRDFQPVFHKGTLVEWRRVHDHKLEVAEVTVHASGRVIVHYRSREDGKRST